MMLKFVKHLVYASVLILIEKKTGKLSYGERFTWFML